MRALRGCTSWAANALSVGFAVTERGEVHGDPCNFARPAAPPQDSGTDPGVNVRNRPVLAHLGWMAQTLLAPASARVRPT
jgi:hypothetical protein